MSEIVSYGSGVRNRSLKICFCIFFHLGKWTSYNESLVPASEFSFLQRYIVIAKVLIYLKLKGCADNILIKFLNCFDKGSIVSVYK
jgi:hypothetical protein